VHEEAERLEHVISEEMEERIAVSLGDPQHDPHGDPIPSRDLQMPESTDVTLSQLRPFQKAQVMRVSDSDPDLLRYLSEMGVEPAARLEILDYSNFDNNLQVQVTGEDAPVVLGARVTSQIFVQISE
jgi:DtxR family Mn-dependent transcriptional regulator